MALGIWLWGKEGINWQRERWCFFVNFFANVITGVKQEIAFSVTSQPDSQPATLIIYLDKQMNKKNDV